MHKLVAKAAITIKISNMLHLVVMLFIDGSKWGREGSKFFQFHAVFGENWQNRMLGPLPEGLTPPRRGNPGSTTTFVTFTKI